MARKVQFEDDDETTKNERDEEVGREVDLSDADAEDNLEDLKPRGMLRVRDDGDKARGETDADGDGDEIEVTGGDDEGGSDEWRNRLLKTEKLVEDLSDQTRDLRDENDALKRRVNAREAEGKFALKKAEIDGKLADVRKKLAAAMEAGETEKTVALQEELADLKADLKVAESDARRAAEAAPQNTEADTQPTKAKQWMAKHPKFKTDPVFKAAASAIDKQVAADGFDMNSNEYYAELDKRLKRRFPEEYKGDRTTLPPRQQHPANGGDRDESQGGGTKQSGGFKRRGNKVMLTPQQLKNMARFNLDPDSPEDQKEYVRNNMGGK